MSATTAANSTAAAVVRARSLRASGCKRACVLFPSRRLDPRALGLPRGPEDCAVIPLKLRRLSRLSFTTQPVTKCTKRC